MHHYDPHRSTEITTPHSYQLANQRLPLLRRHTSAGSGAAGRAYAWQGGGSAAATRCTNSEACVSTRTPTPTHAHTHTHACAQLHTCDHARARVHARTKPSLHSRVVALGQRARTVADAAISAAAVKKGSSSSATVPSRPPTLAKPDGPCEVQVRAQSRRRCGRGRAQS